MNSLGRQTLAGLRILLVLTVLTGVLYPLGVWVVSHVPGLEANAEGSMVTVDGRTVGSDLIGIDPVAGDPNNDPWFHTRPSASASDENGLGPADASTSGGSNKGGYDADLAATVKARQEIIARREGVAVSRVPADAVTASASGLDPDISPAYAALQVARVARVNGLSGDEVRALVDRFTDGRGLGFVGEPGVNVMELNLAVQAAKQ
ncbi:potassium-transporting ATPase subunit C [Actinophytocola oryzae]|uniref:Potassium-transporting ATPase KdpC subunit n=1 Tax=Actinophytocola oryzae TaxID=502181 RepID=A0A4V3FR55_9PSEU|nr:potassium-transporting ATPase subunit C [Actinophytocola oryzae]TDV42251.1 K+-transporting ATPase ATPase C chain [Actinophytocola oryzae]